MGWAECGCAGSIGRMHSLPLELAERDAADFNTDKAPVKDRCIESKAKLLYGERQRIKIPSKHSCASK